VVERVVGCHRLLAGGCQQLHHRLRTARASVRYRGEQPGAEDVLALCLWGHARRRPASRTVDIQYAPVRELDVVEEAHVGAVPRQGAGDSNRGPGLEQVWRDPVARQLGDAVRFADVVPRLAVLVDRCDVEVTVRVPRLELLDGPGDAHRFAGIEMRREAVMSQRLRYAEQQADHYRQSGSRGEAAHAILHDVARVSISQTNRPRVFLSLNSRAGRRRLCECSCKSFGTSDTAFVSWAGPPGSRRRRRGFSPCRSPPTPTPFHP